MAVIHTAAVLFGAITLIAACSPTTETTSTATQTPSATTSASTPQSGPLRGPEPSAATPLVARSLAEPIPVPATDGKVHLAYELLLTNVLPQEVTLTSVTVLDRDVALLTLAGDQVSKWTRLLGTPTPTTKVSPSATAVVWLDVQLDKDAAVPQTLTHSIGVSLSEPQPPLLPATMTEHVAPVTVQTRKPIVIAPPLAGPSWLDGDSCCEVGAHRGALNPINGQLWAAERFAIDYVQLSPDGRLFIGDKTKVESYPGFGADIYAVTDGPVVIATDGLEEQVAGKNPTGLTLDQYPGNPHGAGPRRRQLRDVRTHQDGQHQGQAGRSGEGRAADRFGRQHWQYQSATPAFPGDERPGPAACRRPAVGVRLVQTRLPGVADRRSDRRRSVRCYATRCHTT